MASKPLPSPELLRQILRYEPETGHFYWNLRSAETFEKSSKNMRLAVAVWNGKYSGKIAGYVNGRGYRHITILKVNYKAHRIAWALSFGEWPNGEIDHINGDKLDNRIANLRVVDRTENSRNQRLRRDSKSGIVGVSFYRGNWIARIKVGRKSIELGQFETQQAAVDARNKASTEYGFHRNHGKTPITK